MTDPRRYLSAGRDAVADLVEEMLRDLSGAGGGVSQLVWARTSRGTGTRCESGAVPPL